MDLHPFDPLANAIIGATTGTTAVTAHIGPRVFTLTGWQIIGTEHGDRIRTEWHELTRPPETPHHRP